MYGVRVEIVRFVDDSQPGWVECRLVDARGQEWLFVEKVPIVTSSDLTALTPYPQTQNMLHRFREAIMRDKRSKFVQLANQRVTKAIDQIRLIGNLSNRAAYDFGAVTVTFGTSSVTELELPLL